MFAQPALATLNHLLSQSGWALQRLTKFSGKTASFNIAPFSVICTIQNDGALCEAATDVIADAICTIPLSLLPRLALRDEDAFRQIESSGDTELLTEIFFLARNLRWDAAEDLSKITGDIAAERLVQFAKAKQQLVRNTALNLSQALAEYWTEERPLLAKPLQLSCFANEVNQLRNDAEQLERRIEALSSILSGERREP